MIVITNRLVVVFVALKIKYLIKLTKDQRYMKPFSKIIRDKIITDIDSKSYGTGYNDSQFFNDFLNLNSINLDLSEELYRIFQWKYFIEDLRIKKLTFVLPSAWEDKFENFMLNFPVLYNGKVGDITLIRDSFYVSCWSLKQECDGLWRSKKAKKKDCIVKVKVSSQKLFKSIYNIIDPIHDSKYFIGKVRYLSDERIMGILDKVHNINELDDGLEFVQKLIVKRKPFDYEKEVRVIIRDENYKFEEMKITIDPNFLFEEITLDPWIKYKTFKNKEKEIRDAGFRGRIVRSSLYDKMPNKSLKLK
ncbi:MAG: hypothetical protein JW798_00010 [Prolixibacteraceae bacterium]|nr:hypothetical protein [Prolixibacteraceae bacterium]